MAKQPARRARLEIGGDRALTFTIRESGVLASRHILQDLGGWFGGVGVKGENSERTGHGLFPERSTRTGRSLTLRGTLWYQDPAARDVADRLVSGVLWDGGFGRLTVLSGDLELTAAVKLDGEVGHAWKGKHALEVQIPLLAPDPFLYAEEHVHQLFPAGFGEGLQYPLFAEDVLDFGDAAAGSMLPLRNGGNAKAWPRFVVRGTWPSGFTLTSGQDVVEYAAPVFSQTPVVVDMRAGSISAGGHDMTHTASKRRWFGIDPESVIQPRITAVGQGNGWVDVHLADTYI